MKPKQKLEEKNIITAGISTTHTISSTEREDLELTTIFAKKGDKLTISNGEIVIGEGISKVKVSAQIGCEGGIVAGDRIMMYVKKISNGSDSSISISSHYANGAYECISSGTKLVDIQEGDTIKIEVRNVTSGRGIVSISSYHTYITVEAV